MMSEMNLAFCFIDSYNIFSEIEFAAAAVEQYLTILIDLAAILVA
jgi:hypothetical protein